MSGQPEVDKSGEALAAQRFQMLEDIAKELAGEVMFPTCFETSERLRKLLDDPEVALEKVATAVSLDPLVSSKLVNLANSAAYGLPGQTIRDVRAAIHRLGLQVVRTTSLAIAMRQMLLSRDMVDYAEFCRRLWLHSLDTAAAAWVIAKRMTRLNPDEALLAGLVHDLGAFYMLYRAMQYPELRARPQTVKHLIMQWHESIGVTLLASLGLPHDLAEATADHDQLRPLPPTPRNLADVVYVANVLAGSSFEWLLQDIPAERLEQVTSGPQYGELQVEIAAHVEAMRAVFS